LRIIKNRRVVDDEWIRIENEESIPDEGNVIVPLARWLANPVFFADRPGKAGVCVSAEDSVDELIPYIHLWPVIAIEFREFNDGRGHSQARLLREKLAYRGELRAVGDIRRDQVFYLARCGIDVFELRAGVEPGDVLRGFEDFTLTYQPAGDGVAPISHLR